MSAGIPTPSPLTKLLKDEDESALEPTRITAVPPPAVPRLSPLELELRTRMGVVDATSLRVEKLVAELQVEGRQQSAGINVRLDVLAGSIDTLSGEVAEMRVLVLELVTALREEREEKRREKLNGGSHV